MIIGVKGRRKERRSRDRMQIKQNRRAWKQRVIKDGRKEKAKQERR